jgi:hypothetical protein
MPTQVQSPIVRCIAKHGHVGGLVNNLGCTKYDLYKREGFILQFFLVKLYDFFKINLSIFISGVVQRKYVSLIFSLTSKTNKQPLFYNL